MSFMEAATMKPNEVVLVLSSVLFAGAVSDAEAARTRASSASPPQSADAAGGNPSYYDVFGKRYRVRESSDGYRERGIASWYGYPFHGRPTSSGEIYDMHEMTAAHPTLPIPTWVEVTNLANGKRVTVKVNDRGPFVGKRLIDLSYAAATALDMVRNGTTRVEVRALPGPRREMTADRRDRRDQTSPDERGGSAEPAVRPTAPTKSRSESPPRPAEASPSLVKSERLFAEAGKFRNRDDAVQLVDGLKAQGFLNAFVVTEDRRRKMLHRVRVGPLLDEAEVERMNHRLRALGGRHSHMVAMQ
jgi:rare lipoprotein A